MSQESKAVPPVEVPAESLSEELLTAVIENFILREGTDYGAVEVSLGSKIEQVSRQIKKGEVKVVFDPTTETVTLMTVKQYADQVRAANLQKDESPNF